MRGSHLLLAAGLLVGCGGGGSAAPAVDAAPLPECVNAATPLALTYAATEVSADCNLLVRDFHAVAASLTGYSSGQNTTTMEFRWREKACIAMVLTLTGASPAVGRSYGIGTAAGATLSLVERECDDNGDGKRWAAVSGKADVVAMGDASLDVAGTFQMAPDAKLPGAHGTFAIGVTLMSGCYAQLP